MAMSAEDQLDFLDLPLREKRRRLAALRDPSIQRQLAELAGHCSECGDLIRNRPRALTCSTDCADERRKRRNRERAGSWRDRAKQAMAERLDVFGPTREPPPIQYTHLLASVPAGSVLTLTLPTGDSISWSRR